MNYRYTAYHWDDVYLSQQEVERAAKVKREDQQRWDTAVANLEARMRYNNEHQA